MRIDGTTLGTLLGHNTAIGRNLAEKDPSEIEKLKKKLEEAHEASTISQAVEAQKPDQPAPFGKMTDQERPDGVTTACASVGALNSLTTADFFRLKGISTEAIAA